MDEAFATLVSKVPSPQLVSTPKGSFYRYAEQTAHQAIIQKLARYVSSLRAARLLHKNGFVQEQAALQRTLDEFREDVEFLALALWSGKLETVHEDYLRFFYQEEFDNLEEPLQSSQRRPTVPRRKIHAYIVRATAAANPDPSLAARAFRSVSKAYSGFVHGASPHIMDMCIGVPPRFHLQGMLGTPRIDEAFQDLWNYFYRGLLVFAFAAAAFDDNGLFESIRRFASSFAARSGRDYLGSV